MASPTGGTWRRPSRDGATCRSFCTQTNPFVLTDVSIGIWFEFHVWGVDPSAIFIDSIDQKDERTERSKFAVGKNGQVPPGGDLSRFCGFQRKCQQLKVNWFIPAVANRVESWLIVRVVDLIGATVEMWQLINKLACVNLPRLPTHWPVVGFSLYKWSIRWIVGTLQVVDDLLLLLDVGWCHAVCSSDQADETLVSQVVNSLCIPLPLKVWTVDWILPETQATWFISQSGRCRFAPKLKLTESNVWLGFKQFLLISQEMQDVLVISQLEELRLLPVSSFL